MTKKIYITRHGQTDFNKIGVVQGSGIDADLNELGRRQAGAFYDRFKNFHFDKLYISQLKRTAQSMSQFIEAGLPYEQLEGLNEISWGSREGKTINEEGNTYYANMINEWKSGNTAFAIDGGESPDMVAKRMRKALETIMEREDEKDVLICMHGRALRIMLTMLLNYPLSAMDMFEHHNLCLYELEHTGSMFKLNRYNDISHLTALNAR